MNRGFTLSVPELYENLDDMKETCEKIVKSIDSNLWKLPYENIFKALYVSYMKYKKELEEKYGENESNNPLCHGSRDFYYLIKNIAYNFSSLLKQKKEIKKKDEIEIVKIAIERNFDSLHLIEGKGEEKEKNNESTNIKSKDSIDVFKKCYLKNFENKLQNEYEEFENKKDVMKNIISNLKDKNSRNLLLITKTSLNLLLYETLLKYLNKDKEIIKIDPIFKIGSPFEDDKGEEYKLKIINKIKEHAKNGDILILQKFSKILSSFYELFNLNYIKKDGKNYARIAVGKSREQFIEVNEKFKVILLFDNKEIENILQPIASRFEKIEVDFSNLLTDKERHKAINYELAINRLTKIKLSEGKKLNYDLNNLIVNLDLEEIQSMIYYCRVNNIEEEKFIYDKITPSLPQDLIGCLIFDGLLDISNELNRIKKIYDNISKYNNIKDFLKELNNSKNKYFIIYTFSDLSEQFNDIENNIVVEMESLIKCEDNLEIILKNFYKDEEKQILALKIQANSVEDVLYLKTFIKTFEDNYYSNYYINDECKTKKYIFTIHILRQFEKNRKKKNKKTKKNKYKYNPISYTSNDVQHLFIDNLNGSEITLNDINNEINKNNVNGFIHNNLNINKEFCSIALDFYFEKIKDINSSTKGIDYHNFIDKMEQYLEKKDDEYKQEIIEKINNIITTRIRIGNVLKKMYEDNYVKNRSIDIASTLSKYILYIYKQYALEILNIIENNYFLTTIMVINTNIEINDNKFDNYSENDENEDEENEKNPDKLYVKNKVVKNISLNYLELLLQSQKESSNDNLNKNKQLCLLYKIPGLYNLYKEINNYIEQNIKSEFFGNEKVFRLALPKREQETQKLKNDFHEKEENLLDKLYNFVVNNDYFKILLKEQNSYDSDNKKEFEDFIDLLLRDYITYYLLQRYQEKNNNDNTDLNSLKNCEPFDIEHELILLLLRIRFRDDKEKENINIVAQNKNDQLKLSLFKIMWMESNYDYIINILEVYNIFSPLIINNDDKNLFNDIYEYIKKDNVKYIAQEKRNPEHTKEINECFYLILASICQCISSEGIIDKLSCDYGIYDYIEKCKEALPIITRLSDDLLLFLNEKYIIEEFLLIIDVANRNQLENNFSKEVLLKLKNMSSIIQTSENKVFDLNKAFLDLNKYIITQLNRNVDDDMNDKNDDVYYSLLSNFYLKELRRLSDINYKTTILEQILSNDNIIKKSLKSFKVLFKNLLEPEIDKFENILLNLDNKTDDVLGMIEKKKKHSIK